MFVWLAKVCIPALLACISIAFQLFPSIALLQFLCAFLLYSGTDSRGKLCKISTLCVHLNCVALLSQHIRLCAFLLCSSTVGVHFYYVQAHSAAHSALTATVLQHCVRVLLLYSSTFLVAFTHVCICMCMWLDASTVKIFPKWVHARLLSANVHKHFHVCVHFYFVCISIVIQHFFFACISIVLQHFFFAYFLCISTLLHISTV